MSPLPSLQRLETKNLAMSQDPVYRIPLSHFENIVAVALADGYLAEDEQNFLMKKGEEYGLPTAVVEHIISMASLLQFQPPSSETNRHRQLSDAIHIALIDGQLHPKEYDLCMSLASRLGFTTEDVDRTIAEVEKERAKGSI